MEPVAARQRPIGLAAHATREWFSRMEPTVGLPSAQATGMRPGHSDPIGFLCERGGSCIVHAYKSKHVVCHTEAIATFAHRVTSLPSARLIVACRPRSGICRDARYWQIANASRTVAPPSNAVVAPRYYRRLSPRMAPRAKRDVLLRLDWRRRRDDIAACVSLE